MSKTRAFKIGRHTLLIGIGISTALLSAFLLLRLLFTDRWWWLAFLNNFTPYYFLLLVVVIPLALLLRSRRILAVSLILAVIAVIWFGPRFMPKAVAHTQGKSLSIVTFNVWELNAYPDAVEHWLRDTNAELVLLQEKR